MATYISAATGNFTSTGTWATVGTGEVDVSNGTQQISTGNTDSPTFVPAASAIDGIALKMSSRTSSGTTTITLRNSTGATDVASITCNVTDLPNIGWFCVKFGSSHTPNGTDSYVVRVTSSATNAYILQRSTTGTTNFDKMIRLTANPGALSAGDKFMIMGEITAAATTSAFTVTMDNTATTSWGPTVSGGPPQGFTINRYGTLTFGVAASTNYYLKIKGATTIFDGGTMNIGTSGAQMPSTSTAVLEFDSAVNVDSGLVVQNGGTLNVWGATVTNVTTYMTADKSATDTVIALVSTTSMVAGDVLAFASTSRTHSEREVKTISSVDSATQVTLTAGLTNGHSGTSPARAEVVDLTKNVKIRGVSTSLQGYIDVKATAAVTARYAEFANMGSGTALKRGIDIGTTSGTFDVRYCVAHDFIVASSIGFNFAGVTVTGTCSVKDTAFYQINNIPWIFNGTIGVTAFDDIVAIGTNANSGNGCACQISANSTFTSIGNLTITSCNDTGLRIRINNLTMTGFLTLHSNATNGLQFVDAPQSFITIPTLNIWRNNSTGLIFDTTANRVHDITVQGGFLFGNLNRNIDWNSSNVFWNLVFQNMTLAGDSTFATAVGVFSDDNPVILAFRFETCSLGAASGILVAHSTADVSMAFTDAFCELLFTNCILASATEVSGGSSITTSRRGYISFQKRDQVAQQHNSFIPAGLTRLDTVIFNIASQSRRLVPSSATVKMKPNPKRFAIDSGEDKIVSVYVRKSQLADGNSLGDTAANYNGAQPRLILKANPALGVTSDTVLDTMSAGLGTWEQLSGTTPAASGDDGVFEVYVDCDGTAGWVNVGDWSFT